MPSPRLTRTCVEREISRARQIQGALSKTRVTLKSGEQFSGSFSLFLPFPSPFTSGQGCHAFVLPSPRRTCTLTAAGSSNAEKNWWCNQGRQKRTQSRRDSTHTWWWLTVLFGNDSGKRDLKEKKRKRGVNAINFRLDFWPRQSGSTESTDPNLKDWLIITGRTRPEAATESNNEDNMNKPRQAQPWLSLGIGRGWSFRLAWWPRLIFNHKPMLGIDKAVTRFTGNESMPLNHLEPCSTNPTSRPRPWNKNWKYGAKWRLLS